MTQLELPSSRNTSIYISTTRQSWLRRRQQKSEKMEGGSRRTNKIYFPYPIPPKTHPPILVDFGGAHLPFLPKS